MVLLYIIIKLEIHLLEAQLGFLIGLLRLLNATHNSRSIFLYCRQTEEYFKGMKNKSNNDSSVEETTAVNRH